MQGCGKEIHGRLSFSICGKFYAGRMVLCSSCKIVAAINYPQGWNYYPGDVCEHGVYTGGSGTDYMCGRCESGD